jgi:hypothetical protein
MSEKERKKRSFDRLWHDFHEAFFDGAAPSVYVSDANLVVCVSRLLSLKYE